MAIQKHNTYYDPKKPNEGITYYDENGNHKEVLTRNDLNAISSISSINDKVTALSAKTVTQIKSTETVTATPHTATDGTIYYELEAAPEISETVIYGINGISSTHEGTVWTIGLSSDFLSANALNSFSGNWQDTYNSVKSNSANWNEVSSKLDQSAFNSWSAQIENWDITEYSGGFGIDVTDHTISLTENYLSANALDNLSGKWEKASDTLIASSGKWNDTYETVSANSARWNKVDEKLDTSVFEAYTATADDIQYSGKNGIAIEKHEVWISADYLSANALKDLSGKWENASDVVIADSAKWNSAYSAIASANLWNGTYERVQASADEWDKVVNKIDKSESAKYMLVDKIDKTTDDKISGYNGLELYYPPVKEYSGKNGIKVEDYFIGIDSGWLDERYQEKGDYLSASEKFLSANALDELSGNWESTYKTVNTKSATWEKVKDLHNVEISSTNGSIGVTATTAGDGTVKYDLSVDEVEVPNISGYNGISARFNEETNQYEVGFKENDYAYLFGHYGNNSTLTDGTILKLDSNNYYNITIDEDGYITLPQTTNKFTFCINEYIDDNTTQNHEYLLNKLVLSAKNSDSIVTSQNYYPSEVGSSNVTLALTIDNSISPKEYCIVYKGSDVAANKLKVEASILEEVTSLDSSRGEVDDYTGREPIRVVQNSRVVELLYDENVFTLKQDASLGAKKLTIEGKSGEVVNKETFDKLLDSINSRIVETIPIGTINYHSYINAGQAISYIFRPMIEFEMNQQTTARIIAGNAAANQSQVMISVYELNETNYTLSLVWWSELKTLTQSKGEQVLLANNGVGQTVSIKPDGLYYVRMICLGQQIQQLLGLQNTVHDDLGNYDLVYIASTTNTNPFDYIGQPAGSLGDTASSTLKPYVGFKNVGSNS